MEAERLYMRLPSHASVHEIMRWTESLTYYLKFYFTCLMLLSIIGSFSILVFYQFPKEKKNVFTYPLLLSPTAEDRLAIFFSVFTIMLKNTLIQRLSLLWLPEQCILSNSPSWDNSIKVHCWASNSGFQCFTSSGKNLRWMIANDPSNFKFLLKLYSFFHFLKVREFGIKRLTSQKQY